MERPTEESCSGVLQWRELQWVLQWSHRVESCSGVLQWSPAMEIPTEESGSGVTQCSPAVESCSGASYSLVLHWSPAVVSPTVECFAVESPAVESYS